MKTLTIREVRAALAHLEDILAEDGEVLVTRRGQAVARLLPVQPTRAAPSHADLRTAMPRLSVPSEVHVREDRDSR